jgi:hypothetical protein
LQGNGIEKYQSRSHAEAAIVLMLVNAGFDFDAVLSLFTSYPCAGKFKERDAQDPDKAISQYLYPTFLSAVRKMQEGRTLANAAMQWAQAQTWKGRTGLTDRAVFIAHAEIAQHAGCIEYGASSRTLAEIAQVDHKTATHATHRLMDASLLESVKRSDRYSELASVYRLIHLHHSPYSNPVEDGDLCKRTHDAFRVRGYGDTFKARGLGKAAERVFEELRKGEPLTVQELTEKTGRHFSTVWRVLNRMARIVDPSTGEIVATMVEQQDGGKWRACDAEAVDLDRIAKALGTFGASEWQKKKHADERKAHSESLQHGASQARPRQVEVIE